jgi:hypothetical protein
MSKYLGRIITNQAPAGYSVFFDGTGDWVSVADSTAFTLGSGNFTIEFWVYSTLAAQRQFIAGQMASSGANSSASFTIEKTVGNKLLCGYYSAALQYGATSSADIPLNTWAHIAFVRDGNTLRQYINGVQDGSVSVTGVTANDSSNQLAIGRSGEFASTFYFGYVSNFRFVNGTCLYPSGTSFTPPTQLLNVTNTSLLTCNSPAIVDQSSNAFAITVNGNAAPSTFTPFAAYNPYNPALGASTPGVWTLDEAMQAAATRQWNMYDPSFQNTTLLLHGNGTNGAQNNTFLDSSSNNFTITRNGNTTQGTFSPFSQTGWSNYFVGSSDYLTAPSNTAFAMGTGDFTVECWFYLTNTGNKALWGIGDGTTSGGVMFRVETGANRFNFYNTTDILFTGAAISPFVWYHVAVVRSAGSLSVYLNGSQYGSSVANTTNIAQNIFYIGAAKIGATVPYNPMEGYLSNLRVIKGTAVYTGNFAPPTSPLTTITNTSLLTCQSNRFVDNSTNNFAITVNGNTSVQAFSPFYPTAAYTPQTIGGSGYFDGTGDYLTVPDSDAFNFGSGAFTIEAWVYANALGVYNAVVAQWPVNGGSTSNSFVLESVGSNMDFYWVQGTTLYGPATLGTISTGTWTHYAICRSGNTLYPFKNGVLGTTVSITQTLNNATANVTVGGEVAGGGYWNGYISNVRIIKGTALYTTAFTPPTAPLTNITNTSLLLNFTNAGIVDSTAKNVLETVGNAQISTTQSKFGGSSMSFDGTGDVVFSPYGPNLNLGSGDFTIECWVYFNTLPSNNYVLFASYGNSVSAQRWIFGYDTRSVTSSPGIFFTVINASNSVIVDVKGAGTSGWATGTWYHVAVTRNGSSWRLFRDGVQNGSTVTDTDAIPDATANGLNIGAEPDKSTAAFNGYLDDFRITKGVARYTANFTPQTSQWQDQ